MVKNLPSVWETGFDPQIRKIPWRRACLPTPVFLPGEFHGQTSLTGYSPWGPKELDMTEWLTLYDRIQFSLFWFFLLAQFQRLKAYFGPSANLKKIKNNNPQLYWDIIHTPQNLPFKVYSWSSLCIFLELCLNTTINFRTFSLSPGETSHLLLLLTDLPIASAPGSDQSTFSLYRLVYSKRST